MATFALIHGAGDVGWYWHLVAAELLDRGHDVVAPDLPSEVDSAGLAEYADTVVDAIGDRSDVVVAAQSFGGFIAPMVCQRTPVDLLVLLAGMIPLPGETPDDWWANTDYLQAQRKRDEHEGRPTDDIAMFYHDVPPDLAAEALRRASRPRSRVIAVRARVRSRNWRIGSGGTNEPRTQTVRAAVAVTEPFATRIQVVYRGRRLSRTGSPSGPAR